MMNSITKTHLEKAAQLQDKGAGRVLAARAALGKRYSQHLVMLEQTSRLGRQSELTEEDRQAIYAAGCWVKQDADGKYGVYAKTVVPYLTVEGRLQIFLDELQTSQESFSMQQEIDWEHRLLTITVSCPKGTAVGSARIGESSSGVDATNPVENAQTSALGRALGFLGYGLLVGEEEAPPVPPVEPASGAAVAEGFSAATLPMNIKSAKGSALPLSLPAEPAIGEAAPPESGLSKEEKRYLFEKAQAAGFTAYDNQGRLRVDLAALGAFLKENNVGHGLVKDLSLAEYRTALALLDVQMRRTRQLSAA